MHDDVPDRTIDFFEPPAIFWNDLGDCEHYLDCNNGLSTVNRTDGSEKGRPFKAAPFLSCNSAISGYFWLITSSILLLLSRKDSIRSLSKA